MKKFRVHISGCDDISEPQTEIDALRSANHVNKIFLDLIKDEVTVITPICVATVFEDKLK